MQSPLIKFIFFPFFKMYLSLLVDLWDFYISKLKTSQKKSELYFREKHDYSVKRRRKFSSSAHHPSSRGTRQRLACGYKMVQTTGSRLNVDKNAMPSTSTLDWWAKRGCSGKALQWENRRWSLLSLHVPAEHAIDVPGESTRLGIQTGLGYRVLKCL